MRGAFLVLLFLISPSQEAGQLRTCVEEDICSTIIFNQLAIATLQEDVSALVTDVRGMMKAFNSTIASVSTAEKEELGQCLERADQLEKVVGSLENKYNEIKSKDQKQKDESENFRQEIEALKIAQRKWEEEKQRNEQEILQLREDIKNLTLKREIIQRSSRPVDCADIQAQGNTKSGVYTIYPFTDEKSIEAFCDLESGGGGWTVFLARQPQEEPLDFNESWENFKNGFGDVNKEFWLGNDIIHTLTSREVSSLRIDAEIFQGERRWAEWNLFSVGNEDSKYQLTINLYSNTSTMGDSLNIINGTFFTTFDVDNDNYQEINCAIGTSSYDWGKGGWWYNGCGNARPTAPLIKTNNWDSCCWLNWDPTGTTLVSLKTLSLKLRRHNYMELSSPCAKCLEGL